MLGVVAVLVGPLLLLMGGGLTAATFVFPEADRPLGGTVALVGCGVGLFALGVFVFVVWSRKRRTTIQLYEGGIVELVGAKRRQLSWQGIATFSYATITTGLYGVSQLTIEPQAGPRWKLNSQHVLGLDAIAAKLAHEVTNLTLPLMRERLAAGEQLAFGKLALSQQGIHKGRRLLPWAEIAGVWSHLGFLRVLRHGDAGSALIVSVTQLKRVDALVVLIGENCGPLPVHAPFSASQSFRRVVPKLVGQTLLGGPPTALLFGVAGYNLWRAFRLLGPAATTERGSAASAFGWALVSAALAVLLAVVVFHDITQQLRQRRRALRLAKAGRLVPVMVLENTFEQWSFHSGWRYRYLTPHGIEAVDRVDVSMGGAATWAPNKDYLLALCSEDERESLLITLSGYPLACLPAVPEARVGAPS